MKFRTKNNKDKEAAGSLTSTAHVAVAGAVLALALTTFFAVSYGVRTTSSAAKEAADYLTSKLADQIIFAKAARTADLTREERANLSKHVIQKEGGAAFISLVESLGDTVGAPIQLTSVGTTPGDARAPGLFNLTLQFSGSYAACIRLVRLIETMPVSTSVSAMELSYDDTRGRWNGTVSISTLSFDIP